MGEIKTYTGKYIDPVNPDPEKFEIRDIAHALSLTCRGNGQVRSFYSVAQHCICCALEAERRGLGTRVALACLLHDASESYMSDVPRPFKEVLNEYNILEGKLLEKIYTKYLGSPLNDEEQAALKKVDDDMLWFDLKYLLEIDVADPKPEMHIEIDHTFVPFEKVENQYLEIFERLMSELYC